MSYNGSGTFVINSTGQPVVTGTVISSSTFNSLTADLGTGLTTAITKDGQTTTTAKIPFAQGLSAAVASNFAAGTVGAPSIYLSTDTTTGLYRIGANNDGFAVSGVKLLDLSSALLGITGALTVSTTLGVTGLITATTAGISVPTSAAGTVHSGTYTPTLTNSANIDASTAFVCQYIRVGNVVTVSGQLNIDFTSAATYTSLGMSLPIASDFANGNELGGVASSGVATVNTLGILADVTNNRAQFDGCSAATVNTAMRFSFTYLIL
jgi:hypothetical protein